MTNYLVLGGAGFIGSQMIKTIFKNEPDAIVVNLDTLTYAGNINNLGKINNNKNYHFYKGDINDNMFIANLLNFYDFDKVVNFAAETHVDNSIGAPMIFMKTNVMGTSVLLSECREYYEQLEGRKKDNFRYLHISTDEVFGALGIDDFKFYEETPYDPRSPYSASKASSDHLVRAYIHTYDFPALITNCSNNYGPYQHPEKLIPKVISNIIMEKPIPVYGDGQQIRDWIYVEDHCEALYEVLHKGVVGETYCIGANEEHANIDIVEMICEICDGETNNSNSCKSLINFVKDRPGHDFRYAIDSSKIFYNLGWSAKTSFYKGLEKTVVWYLQNPQWILEMELKKENK